MEAVAVCRSHFLEGRSTKVLKSSIAQQGEKSSDNRKMGFAGGKLGTCLATVREERTEVGKINTLSRRIVVIASKKTHTSVFSTLLVLECVPL